MVFFLCIFFIKKTKQKNLDSIIELYKARIVELSDTNSSLTSVNISLEKKVSQLEEVIGSLEREKISNEEISSQSYALLKSQLELFINEFLEKENKQINDNNVKSLSLILSPLNEKIKDFQNLLLQYNLSNVEQATKIQTEIKGLAEISLKTSKEANNLATAIRGSNKLQGLWGELVLENVLEQSGLQKDREYIVQKSLKDENGKIYRPDIIVKLPDSKHIVIDSKVSLLSYEKFFNSEDPNIKQEEIKNHINSIRSHIKELSAKNYQNLYKIKTLDFVLLFIPMESAFSLVIQKEYEIFSYAYSKNIILVSPSTLLATLKTISSIWQEEYRNLYAQEIARQSGDMYNKFVLFLEELKKIGVKLNQASDSFDSAMSKLSSGNGNLIKRAEKIKELGAKATRSIDIEDFRKYENFE